jgi:hypothetical protein
MAVAEKIDKWSGGETALRSKKKKKVFPRDRHPWPSVRINFFFFSELFITKVHTSRSLYTIFERVFRATIYAVHYLAMWLTARDMKENVIFFQ